MTSVGMDEIVGRIETLPRLPNTAQKIIAVLNDPNNTIEQVVETVRYDQTITAELLRLCNSAHFGLSKTVSSLDEAVSYLGTAKVLQLVIGSHAKSLLSKAQEGYGLRPGDLWKHCVAVALGAQALARRFKLPSAGPVFTAGLLVDIGKVILNEYVMAEYAEIVRRVSEEGVSFLEAEQAVLGFTHPQIGARIAECWALPAAIVRCIRYHHEPESLDEPDPLVDAVHLADTLCIVMGVGGGDDGLLYRAHPAVTARNNVTEADLQLIGVEVVAEMKSVAEAFATA